MQTTATNGTGQAAAVLQQRVITDQAEASVLAMFFIQKLGKASLAQVAERVAAVGAVIEDHLLQLALDALQSRGFLSYAKGPGKSGEMVQMWKTRKVQWANPPEVAHINALLPELIETPVAKEIIGALNADEKQDLGEKKEKRGPDICEYETVTVDFVTLDELIGSQPVSKHLLGLVQASPYKLKEIPGDKDLLFWRDAGDGAIVLTSDSIKGWLRTGLRTVNINDSRGEYVGVSSARIIPSAPLTQVVLPIISRGAGAGLSTCELLPPGQKFSVTFTVPTKGFMSVKEFLQFLTTYAPNPVRGISPARGNRFGKVAVVGFSQQTVPQFSGLPAEARKFAEELFKS